MLTRTTKPGGRHPAHRTIFIILSLLLLAGCGVNYEQLAREHAERLYERLAEGDFEGAAALYDERFYQRVARDTWIDTLRDVSIQLGAHRTHSFMHGGVREEQDALHTFLMYRVRYANGDEAVEQLTFSQGDASVALVNHQLTSDTARINFPAGGEPVRVASSPGQAQEQEPEPEAESAPEEEPEFAAAGEEADSVSAGASPPRFDPLERPAGVPDGEPLAESQIASLVESLRITGIAPFNQRIIAGDSLIERGDTVSTDPEVYLETVEARRVLFRDDRGRVYEREFLISRR